MLPDDGKLRSVDDRAIADELAIRDVILAVSMEADTGDLDVYGALYVDDAVVVTPMGTTEGREGIVDANRKRREAGITGPGTGNRHHVVPGRVTLDGDRATVRSLFTFYRKVEGVSQLANTGEYVDELRREADGWKMVHRTCTFD
jgi:ketosteroid isomerase-like protein